MGRVHLSKHWLLKQQSILKEMKRTSLNDVQELVDLNDLKLIVKDKRVAKRADAKKERRNRHYVKVLIKSQLNNLD